VAASRGLLAIAKFLLSIGKIAKNATGKIVHPTSRRLDSGVIKLHSFHHRMHTYAFGGRAPPGPAGGA